MSSVKNIILAAHVSIRRLSARSLELGVPDQRLILFLPIQARFGVLDGGRGLEAMMGFTTNTCSPPLREYGLHWRWLSVKTVLVQNSMLLNFYLGSRNQQWCIFEGPQLKCLEPHLTLLMILLCSTFNEGRSKKYSGEMQRFASSIDWCRACAIGEDKYLPPCEHPKVVQSMSHIIAACYTFPFGPAAAWSGVVVFEKSTFRLRELGPRPEQGGWGTGEEVGKMDKGEGKSKGVAGSQIDEVKPPAAVQKPAPTTTDPRTVIATLPHEPRYDIIAEPAKGKPEFLVIHIRLPETVSDGLREGGRVGGHPNHLSDFPNGPPFSTSSAPQNPEPWTSKKNRVIFSISNQYHLDAPLPHPIDTVEAGA
ncbi:hypothetical protein BDK51DRAFT_31721 [Blyttiomyces helicus]|uniref:Uncharacterized protein n=1 Tax=Blyttiomyces helicus TaxID=388810 RepID=A0A4P9WMM3_9FUNG|nr:hypothetical protein BDK51DRAFT_31721 [Blyttiomyces helicus]|eukprot:RKO94331.1 hypothetical protein BDK51DRAFT_31721 [Blyttiomyces helicus]